MTDKFLPPPVCPCCSSLCRTQQNIQTLTVLTAARKAQASTCPTMSSTSEDPDIYLFKKTAIQLSTVVF